MLTLTVLKALCQPEVNDVDLILGLIRAPDQEVVGFDVSMNDGIFVNLSQQIAANILEMFRFDLHWLPL